MTTPDTEATMRVDSAARFARHNVSDGQFAPGTLVAERYRIASILGKGGMGEVYRAEDIKLGQAVALKFLPARLAGDAKLLEGLHEEVRLGRQVAHPNVCRIYDIGTWGDAHFVAMEYVDGEDLARLLRRIGRLPHDKAVDIARGVAAGLSAAHAKGILHRDLKPANVMIDSHGDARITDFGLALTTDSEQEDLSGTPAYMAPELLEGSAATMQSDLYALGLVMYETFTGKRPFSGASVEELRREKTSEITTPSNVIRDIEPAVERVILRCLAREPEQRPRSAREVILSLPGGDPLAAALAAGETPSPRLVAAAGTEGTLSVPAAWTLFGATIVLLASVAAIWWLRALDRSMDMLSPDVLRDRADTIIRDFGIPAQGTPISELRLQHRYGLWLQKRWDRGRLPELRTAPAPYRYRLEYGVSEIESLVASPDAIAPGRASIEIDTSGRLASLLVSPREKDVKPRPADWDALLISAGFTPGSLKAEQPRMLPAAPFDARAAWSGTYPRSTTPVRIEAAMWKGVPVFLDIGGQWVEEANAGEGVPFEGTAVKILYGSIFLVVAMASLLLAVRNLRLRRGDRQGAFRLATFIFLLNVSERLLRSSFTGDVSDVLAVVAKHLGASLLIGGVAFLLYIAVEPYVRRRWPDKLISWARLLAGRARDPMVGRDVLIGLAAGLAHTAVPSMNYVRTAEPGFESLDPYLNVRRMISALLSTIDAGVQVGFLYIGLLVLLSIILRKRAVTVAVFTVIVMAVYLAASAGRLSIVPFLVAIGLLEVYILVRHGLLAFAVMIATFFLTMLRITPVFAPWATSLATIPFIVLLIGVLWSFHVSLGGQSPWHPALLEE